MITHEFLMGVMKASSLPGFFINFVKCLYTGATSRINVNGTRSERFKILNGVRQGDALSVLLFFMAVTPLIKSINSCDKIEGFPLFEGNKTVKYPNIQITLHCFYPN